MSPPAVGLVTFAGLPALTADDQLLAEELRRRGARVEALVWDDPGVDWGGFDKLVLRSCWDYHTRPGEFLAWLSRLQDQGAPLWNPVPLVRANAHKSYLRALEAAGAPVMATAWLARDTPANLRRLLEERGWPEAVVKPAVSASAYGTWRTTLAGAPADQARLDSLLARGDVLVQPLAPEVARDGEWSLVFFGGEYSHAVLKRPGAGDFRVQSELGGTETALEPPPALVDQARAVVSQIEGPWLYARVDGIFRGAGMNPAPRFEAGELSGPPASSAGGLVVMELELIEPVLFLSRHPLAPARFADAVLAV